MTRRDMEVARWHEVRRAALEAVKDQIDQVVKLTTLDELVRSHPGLLVTPRHAYTAGICLHGLRWFRQDHGLTGRSARLDVLGRVVNKGQGRLLHRAAIAALMARDQAENTKASR